MISKLKRKFTILATVSMFALMTVLLLIMNLINYSSLIKDSDIILDVLSQPNAPFFDANAKLFEDIENAEFPNNTAFPNNAEFPENAKLPGNDENVENFDNNENMVMPWENFIPRGMSPEVPYESRYFTVMVDANGEVKESNLSQIISVDSNSASEYITKAIDNKDDRGFIGQFRYVKIDDGVVTRIMFLDCGRKLEAFNSFLWTSVAVGFAGCVIVFIGFLFASGRIVKPIAESYEKQKRFISDAGHEIKTPLTIINANVDLLECDGEKEELDEIRYQAKRLTELTNNLVSLSKMEENNHRLQKIEMPLSDIVLEAANSFDALATAKNIEYSKNVKPDVTVCASPDSIRQLVSILLENAVKYTPDGGAIKLTLSVRKKMAILSVVNTTDELLTEENLKHVFDRFYRTDASRNSETGGHGIGLSIAKAIVEKHGGEILATSKNVSDFCITAEIPM